MLSKTFVIVIRGVAAAALLALFAVGPAGAAQIQYVATLSGPNESPPNASPGTGNVTITIDTALLTMRVQASFSGLTGTTTASHIHCCTAVPGVSTAGVATTTPSFVGFPLGVSAGAMDQTYDMTLAGSYNAAFVTAQGSIANARATLFAGLAAGTAYFNIHSTTFPGGEIRGFTAASVAAPQRAFVSTNGLDSNACSLIAPCRGFAAAVTVVATNGEVIALDSGGYGSFNIAKSVTVSAPLGIYAGISVFPGNDGIVVSASNGRVTLKGLTINGQGGNAGINFLQGLELIIENCEIAAVGGAAAGGVVAQAPGGKLVVRDTVIRDTTSAGIWVTQPAAGQKTTLSAENVAVHNAQPLGILVGGSGHVGVAEVYLTHVTVTGSTNVGVLADSAAGGATLASVTNSAISANGVGVRASAGAAKLVVATSTLARNTSFAMDNVGATLLSRGDNTVHDNNGGGAQTNGAIGPSPPL